MDLRVEGSPYFRRINDQLLRAIRIYLPEPFSGPVNCWISGDIGPMRINALAEEGKVLAYCAPEINQDINIQVSIEPAGGKPSGSATISPVRP